MNVGDKVFIIGNNPGHPHYFDLWEKPKVVINVNERSLGLRCPVEDLYQTVLLFDVRPATPLTELDVLGDLA